MIYIYNSTTSLHLACSSRFQHAAPPQLEPYPRASASAWRFTPSGASRFQHATPQLPPYPRASASAARFAGVAGSARQVRKLTRSGNEGEGGEENEWANEGHLHRAWVGVWRKCPLLYAAAGGQTAAGSATGVAGVANEYASACGDCGMEGRRSGIAVE